LLFLRSGHPHSDWLLYFQITCYCGGKNANMRSVRFFFCFRFSRGPHLGEGRFVSVMS
jgi:hypothetical protein